MEKRRLRSVEHLGPDDRVRLHHLEFFALERAGFAEDGVGNADFADVVHGGGHADVFDLVGRPAEHFGEQLAVETGPLDVRTRLFVAVPRTR